jgi:hypothetical protein
VSANRSHVGRRRNPTPAPLKPGNACQAVEVISGEAANVVDNIAPSRPRRARHEVTSLLYAKLGPLTPDHPTNRRAARPLSARAAAVIGFAVLGDVIPEIGVDIEQAARDRAEVVSYLGSGDRRRSR